eukprot:scaffold6587_cov41-Phaeocystis_antarctica.AAC.1
MEVGADPNPNPNQPGPWHGGQALTLSLSLSLSLTPTLTLTLTLTLTPTEPRTLTLTVTRSVRLHACWRSAYPSRSRCRFVLVSVFKYSRASKASHILSLTHLPRALAFCAPAAADVATILTMAMLTIAAAADGARRRHSRASLP